MDTNWDQLEAAARITDAERTPPQVIVDADQIVTYRMYGETILVTFGAIGAFHANLKAADVGDTVELAPLEPGSSVERFAVIRGHEDDTGYIATTRAP